LAMVFVSLVGERVFDGGAVLPKPCAAPKFAHSRFQ
jgi:hypothetical protein